MFDALEDRARKMIKSGEDSQTLTFVVDGNWVSAVIEVSKIYQDDEGAQ